MLSELQLREIEERVSKATPGPWRDDVYVFECGVFEEGDYKRGLSRQIPVGKCDDCGRGPLLATIVREGRTYHRHMREDAGDWRCIFSATNGDEICGSYDYEEGGVASTKEDADFIAHAREDIPALLAYITELETALALSGEAVTTRSANTATCLPPVGNADFDVVYIDGKPTGKVVLE